MTGIRWRVLIVLAVLLLALIVGGIGPFPDSSSPPDWLNDAARDFTRAIAPTFLWGGTIVLLAIYEVLRWQRNDPETPAARWVRRLILWVGFLFLTFAAGRTVLQSWARVGFAVGIGATTLVIGLTGLAIVRTYVWPLWCCRGDLCEQVPPVDGGVVPPAPSVPWDGITDRRIGPPDRRRRPPGGMTPA